MEGGAEGTKATKPAAKAKAKAPAKAPAAAAAAAAAAEPEPAPAPAKQNKKAPKAKAEAEAPAKAEAKARAEAEAPAKAEAERKSSSRMSIYEFTSVIGMRATQLSRGAVPFVPVPANLKIRTNMELREIAIAELRAGRLPFIVRRKMPDGVFETWRLGEMHVPETMFERSHMYDELRDSLAAAAAEAEAKAEKK